MNKVILLGRLVRDPEISYTTGEKQMCIAKFTLAVDRKFKRDGQQSADFINCVAFSKTAEFIEKYVKKGNKLAVDGSWETGSYKNKDGNTVYTNTCRVESVEFGESKNPNNNQQNNAPVTLDTNASNDFMTVPDNLKSDLPFGV